MILDIIIFIFMVLYAWIGSFLYHEFFHIKSQGLLNTGKINIYTYGMGASVNNRKYDKWCSLAGGFLSGIVHLVFALIAYHYDIWPIYIPMSVLGMMNLTYGFWEMKYGGYGREKIYGATLVAMIIFWIVYIIYTGV